MNCSLNAVRFLCLFPYMGRSVSDRVNVHQASIDNPHDIEAKCVLPPRKKSFPSGGGYGYMLGTQVQDGDQSLK